MNKEIKIIYKSVDELIPYENNPRVNDSAIKPLCNSIEKFGFKSPIIIDKDNVIIAGHTRLKAAKRLKMDKVPCVIADDLTEEQVKAYRLADNKVGEISEWDLPKLDLELMDLNLDMSEFGFDPIEEESKEAKENKKQLESMEIRVFEHHDYVVFVFDNQMDWLKICNEFGIHKVDCSYGKNKKVGVGRVFNGKRLIEKIGYKDSDTEQGEKQFDINDETIT